MSAQKRILWIDLLRIISMLMVVILHICMQGGVLHGFSVGSAGYFLSWLLESFCYCAVNCYALITGYIMYNPNKKFNYSRIIPLWLQVFFYCGCILLLFSFLKPESLTMSVLNYLMPVTNNIYWYFTAYFGMFFFIPFMNILAEKLDKKQFTTLAATMFIVFSFVPFTFTDKDPFYTKNGYSMLWLVILYFAGAYIKRFGNDFKIKKRIWLIVYLIASILPLISSALSDAAYVSNAGDAQAGTTGGGTYDYVSPFTVIAAVALFMIIKDTEINNRFSAKLIGFFAPASFGVYLIHVHPLVFDNILLGRFMYISSFHPLAIVPITILTAVLFFAALAAIDYIRILLFRLLRVNKLSESLVNFTVDKIKNMKVK